MSEFVDHLSRLNEEAPAPSPTELTEETAVSDEGTDGSGKPIAPYRFAGQEYVQNGLWKPGPHELRVFAQTGLHLKQDLASVRSMADLVPALVHPYRDLHRFQSPWPLVAMGTAGSLKIRPLTEVVASIVEGLSSAESEEALSTVVAELGRLSAWLQENFATADVVPLSDFKGIASDSGFDSATLDLMMSHIGPESFFIGSGKEGLRRLLSLSSREVTLSRRLRMMEEVQWLASRLEDILRVEEEESKEGHSPDRLEHSMGGAYKATIDFGSLSHLLDEAPHGQALEPSRRTRIEAALKDLREKGDQLFPASASVQQMVHTSIEEGKIAMEERVTTFEKLCRAREIARLEVENRYREDVHDAVFARFAWEAIPSRDRKAFPPVLIHLDMDGATSSASDDLSRAFTLLRKPGCTNVLLTGSRLFNDRVEPEVLSRAARSLLPDSDCFIQQNPVSAAAYLAEGMKLGSRFQGNAVYSVLCNESSNDDLPGRIGSALAWDARIFPSFRFDPEAGPDWADWLSLAGNEQIENPWVGNDVTMPKAPTSEGDAPDKIDPGNDVHRLRLTPGDFLFLRDDARSHFHLLSPQIDDPMLVDLADWLVIPSEERSGFVPFIWVCGPDGVLLRALCSPAVRRATSLVLKQWRVLLEWSGEKSSLVERNITARQEDWEARLSDEVSRIESEFEQRMETGTEELARQIVENIAASMMGLDAASSSAMSTKSNGGFHPRGARPAPQAATPEVTKEPISDSDEQALSADLDAGTPSADESIEDEIPSLVLDDAYIDTPLCTSCNECTELNGQIFGYDDNKQAIIKDASAGPFRDIVLAAEKCPVRIIHPGKPLDESEKGLDEWVERSKPFL